MANDNLNNVIQDIDDFTVSETFTCGVDECYKVYPTQPTLTVLTQNIRSINCNFAGFQVLLTRLGIDCDVILLTECRLSDAPSIPTLSGYFSTTTTINPIQNDGVVVYVKKHIACSIEEVAVQDSNCLLLKIPDNDLAILAIYRSPSYANLDPFLTSLDKTLNDLSKFKNIVIMGDLNIDILANKPKPSTEEYLGLTSYHGLLPAHYFITRDASGRCLDHVLVKTKIPSVTIVPQSTLTDHKAVIFCMKMKQSNSRSPVTLTKIDQEGLKNNIKNINFDYIYQTDNCDHAMSYIINQLKTALNNNTTTVILSRRKKTIKPWITQGLLRCMRNRDKLHKQSNASPNNITLKITYTRYRNYCNSILKKLKRQYDRDLFDKAGKDNKKMWNAIRSITNTTKNTACNKELLRLSETPQKSVNSVNNYFANVGKNLSERIVNLLPTLPDKLPTIDGRMNSFVLLSTDEEEVARLITDLKNECSVGRDGISNRVLKDHKNILVPHLTHVFNMCLTHGIFPKDLKRSRIQPIYKGGDRTNVDNYRPISILPSLSKILEKMINNRLVEYLETKNILSGCQFGFRRGKSTDDAVSSFIDFVTLNLDKSNKCLSIFLDLSKAFDTVSIPILLKKMEKIGIRGAQLKLMQSYLSHRVQYVKVGTHESTDINVFYGVPQGSILGPTLFLIYINDLLYLDTFPGKIISYADDTALIFTGETWGQTYNTAQKGFDMVEKWLQYNVLTLNAEKTKYIAFSIYDNTPDYFQIVSHSCHDVSKCKPLNRTKTVKYLGVIIDENCNFKPHIQQLANRIRKLTYFFKTLRYVVPPIMLKRIYLAFCQSVISYCISSWGGANKTTLLKLEVAQRTMLKLCTFKPFRFSTKLLYEYCEVLTVRQLFLTTIILRQHSIVEHNPALQGNRRGHAVCDRTLRPRTSFIRRFLPFLGPYVYNRINKLNHIYHLKKTDVKKSLYKWFTTLSYDETENIITIIQ